MAIVTTSQNLSAVTYARGEILDIRNGATLTIDATPATRMGQIQCLTSGKLLVQNTSDTVPLVLTLDDMNNDLRFEAAGVFEVRVISGQQRVAGQQMQGIGEQQFLVLLFMVQAEFNQGQSISRQFAFI